MGSRVLVGCAKGRYRLGAPAAFESPAKCRDQLRPGTLRYPGVSTDARGGELWVCETLPPLRVLSTSGVEGKRFETASILVDGEKAELSPPRFAEDIEQSCPPQ